MGRHVGGFWRSGKWRPYLAVLGVVLLVGGVAWWWVWLRSATDPIDAAPVPAYAVVVDSPACGSPGVASQTVISVPGASRAGINACGYRPGQRIAVEYLRGHPDQVRLAGTSAAAAPSLLRTFVPPAVAAIGLVLLATVLLSRLWLPRNRSGVSLAPGRAVSVAALRKRLGDAPGSSRMPLEPSWIIEPAATDSAEVSASAPPASDWRAGLVDGGLFTHRRDSD